MGPVNNLSIVELCQSFKSNNKYMIIDSNTFNTYYKNRKTNKTKKRELIIIVITTKKMVKFLDYNNAIQFGIEFKYKIIPKSFKQYKLITIYCIYSKKNTNRYIFM